MEEKTLFFLLYFAVLGFYLGTVYQRSKENRQREVNSLRDDVYRLHREVEVLKVQTDSPEPAE